MKKACRTSSDSLCTCFPLPKPLCADKRLQRGQEAGHIAPAHEQRDADEDDAADVGERMVAPLAKLLPLATYITKNA